MPDHTLVSLPGARTGGVPDPAEKITVTLGDKTFQAGRRTAAHLEWTIEKLAQRKPGAHLHIMQPCFHTGFDPSAGTHDGDGVLDIRIDGMKWPKAEMFMREAGWAAWWRHTGTWEPQEKWHIHAVSLGCPGKVGDLIPGQVDDYHNKRDGLAGHRPDDSPRPDDIVATVFDYPRYLLIKEDTMPYTDWPREDRKALVKDVADAVLRAVVDHEENLTLAAASRRASRAPQLIDELMKTMDQEP